MAIKSIVVLALASLSSCLPANEKRASLPPKTSVKALGLESSNFPNIYRDGGGGAKINGLNVQWFSDGIYTTDGKIPANNMANWANFTSNSLAVSGYQGAPITSMTDFGNSQKGPNQFIPYLYNAGEKDSTYGIWPNCPIATLQGGTQGVGFPQVVNRTAITAGKTADLYNTPVLIGFTGYGPVASRPVQKLFVHGEPYYGTFSAFVGVDGYLYA